MDAHYLCQHGLLMIKGSSGIEIFRGGSIHPLYVTSAGMDPQKASERIRTMHGAHRIPTQENEKGSPHSPLILLIIWRSALNGMSGASGIGKQ